ncbi:MAG TPA: DUF2177 family protein [Caulobacteraceae bacterium]
MKRRIAFGYLGAGLVFGGLDFAWLATTGQRVYRPALGDLLAPGFRPVPAILFYGIYLVGVTIFAVAPAIRAGEWITAARLGALFGVIAYATYDLTNQATLAHWPTRVTVLDLAWGAFATCLGATAGYFASTALKAG